jgi:hypothetical protein
MSGLANSVLLWFGRKLTGQGILLSGGLNKTACDYCTCAGKLAARQEGVARAHMPRPHAGWPAGSSSRHQHLRRLSGPALAGHCPIAPPCPVHPPIPVAGTATFTQGTARAVSAARTPAAPSTASHCVAGCPGGGMRPLNARPPTQSPRTPPHLALPPSTHPGWTQLLEETSSIWDVKGNYLSKPFLWLDDNDRFGWDSKDPNGVCSDGSKKLCEPRGCRLGGRQAGPPSAAERPSARDQRARRAALSTGSLLRGS